MNQERASLRPASRMMWRIPQSYPLDVQVALPMVRQLELQPNLRLGTDVSLPEHLVRARNMRKIAGMGEFDRENEQPSKDEEIGDSRHPGIHKKILENGKPYPCETICLSKIRVAPPPGSLRRHRGL